MKKRILKISLAVFFSVFLLISLLAVASAATRTGNCGINGSNVTYTLDTETGVLEITGTGSMYPWQMGQSPFSYYYSSQIKTVLISEGVSDIGSYAFYNCHGITSVTIPQSVMSIDTGAFQDCSMLLSITIPDGVMDIGAATFYGCSSLESVMISNNSRLRNIYDYAFERCVTLENIKIPASVTAIGTGAFKNCWNLSAIDVDENNNYYRTIDGVLFSKNAETLVQYPCGKGDNTYTIPDGVKEINRYAFSECSLTGVYISDSVTRIGDYAFEECGGLQNISIGSSVTRIGEKAFYGTSYYITQSNWQNGGLVLYIDECLIEVKSEWSGTAYSIASGTKVIADKAFENCSNLEVVYIPAEVRGVGRYAFSNCTNLVCLWIRTKNATFDSNAILGCPELDTIYLYRNSTADSFFVGDQYTKGYLEYYIYYDANGGENAPEQQRQDSDMDLVITDSIPTRHNYVFVGWAEAPDGEAIYYPGGTYTKHQNATLYAIWTLDNVVSGQCGPNLTWTLSLISGDMKIEGTGEMYSWYSDSPAPWNEFIYAIKTVSIEKGATSIGDDAFTDCSGLLSVKIPDSVTNIGYGAFANCTGLTDIIIPDSVKYIGGSAFWGCTALTNAVIGNGVDNIGTLVFEGCSALKSVTIGNSVTYVGDYMFNGCSNLESVVIGENVTTIGYSAFANCNKIKNLYIAALENWLNMEFCNSSSNIYLSSGGKLYIDGILATDIIIPENITKIRKYAFRNCSNIVSISIPDSVNNIGDYAFYGCEELTSITIFTKNVSITSIAFDNCEKLRTVYLYRNSTADAYFDDSEYEKIYLDGYFVYYDANGGSEAPATQTKALGVDLVLSTLIPTREYYTFVGWAKSPSGTVVFNPGDISTEDKDLTLYAVWKAHTYTITYDADGGEGAPASQIKSHDVKITLSKVIPTKIGYDFVCWIDSNGKEYSPGSVYSANADLVLTAVWKIKTYTVTYDANGGVGAPESQTKIYGVDITLSSVIPTKENCDFKGWAISTSGSVVYAPGAVYTDDSDLKLYAVWKVHTITGKCGDNLTYTLDLALGIMRITGTGEMYSWSSYTGVPWYSYRSYIKTLEIDEGVEEIGTYAFYEHKKLESVYLSNGVKRIEISAFYQCTNLKDLYVPDIETWVGVTLLGEASNPLYLGGGNLYVNGVLTTDIVIPDTGKVTGIGQYAFCGYDKLTSITLPSSVTYIGGSAFRRCENLTGINIPAGVERIYSYTFSGCSNLESVTFAQSSALSYISKYAFAWCESLKSIAIPQGVTNIETYAFYCCFGLEEMSLHIIGNKETEYFGIIFGAYNYNDYETYVPSSLKKITFTGESVSGFYYCYNIESIVLSEGVTSIGEWAFRGCSSLKSITIPETVQEIGESAFEDCRNLAIVKILSKDILIGEYSFNSSGLKTVYLYTGSTADDYFDDDFYEKIYLDGKYLVEYKALGGTNAPLSVLYQYGTLVKVSSQMPTRTGYLFKGWSTKAGNEVMYLPGDSFIVEGDTTLYAIWESVKYTITYDANGGENAPSSTTKSYGYSVRLTSDTPTRLGYYFMGWSTSPIGGVEYAAGGYFDVDADTILYAVWKPYSYLISFDANGGENVPASQTKTHDVPLVITTTVPTMAGYDFVVWQGSNGIEYAPGDTYVEDSELTLVAVWKIRTYSITYDANGGGHGPENATKEHFAEHIISSVVPMREGYDFKGWLGSDGNTYNSGDVYFGNEDLTLTAVWEIKVYTVTFDANGGEDIPEVQTKTHGVPLVLTDDVPTREGYFFRGWSTDADGAVQYNSGDMLNIDGDTVLYAVWEADPNLFVGECGENLTFVFDYTTGKLTIKGTGDMHDFFLMTDAYTREKWTTAPWWKIRNSITSIDLLDGVTEIDEDAFRECSNLVTVFVGSDVTSLGLSTFYGCSSLVNIKVSEDNPNYCDVDGVLFSKDGKNLIFYPCNKGPEYVIPNGVESFGQVFSGCTHLTSVTIPGSVTSINVRAFYGCDSLTSITMLDGVTSIGNSAFYRCINLVDVTIPKSVTSISNSAFENCSNLISVEIPDSVTSIGDYAFQYCESLTGITIPDGVTSIGYYAFGWCDSLANVTISKSVTNIDYYAFCGCGTLSSITFETTSATIDLDAFSHCPELQTIYCYRNSTADDYFSDAKFEKKYLDECTISYDLNGGIGTFDAQTKKAYEEVYLNVNIPTKEGYDFKWWSGSDGKIYLAGDLCTVDKDLILTAIWEIKTYAVTYNFNGGEDGPQNSQKEHFSDYVISLTVPVKKGNAFRYWLGSDGRSYYPGDVYTQDQPLSLTAVWALNIYTISYDLNGGVETFMNEMKYFGVDFVICSYVPTKVGYNFVNWLGSDGESYAPGAVYSTNADLTLTAVWEPKYIVMTYDPNGGNVLETTKMVKYANPIGEMAVPVKNGYTFDGWFTEKTGGVQLTPDSVVSFTENFTVYAHWTPGNYTVSFEANGGTVSPASKVVTFDSFYGELPTSWHAGYTFEGWYTTKDGGELITAKNVVNTASAHTLYARWKANVYLVYFDANGGDCDKKTQNVIFNSEYGELPVPTRIGYTFVCWSRNKNDTDEVTSESNHLTASDITLYAIWSANAYKLTFDTLGGKTDVADMTVTYDAAYGNLPVSFKPNYIFGGWFFEKEYKNKITSDMIVSIANDHTVYAMWIPATFTIVYDANGGEGAPTEQIKNLDVDLVLSSEWPTRKGYKFMGWSTTDDGVVVYDPGATYSENVNLTLYAVWEAIRYGDSNDDGTINAKDAVLLAQYLANWDIDIDVSAADCNGDRIVNAKDAVLLAQYLANWDVTLG